MPDTFGKRRRMHPAASKKEKSGIKNKVRPAGPVVGKMPNNAPPSSLSSYSFRYDETTGEYLLLIPVPGYHREDFKLEIEGCNLVLTAMRQELPTGSVTHTCIEKELWAWPFTLPPDADTLMAQAEYKFGQLTVHIPKSALLTPEQSITVYIY